MNRAEEILQLRLLGEIASSLARVEKLLVPTTRAKSIHFYTLIHGQRKKVVQMFLKVTDKLPVALSTIANPSFLMVGVMTEIIQTLLS